MHSLLADYEQSGFLPKWAFADYDSDEINGDSADPILAEAYAFGVRNFDAREALRAMVKGADAKGTGLGWDVARQDNDQYLAQGWIQVDRRDKTSFDYTVGGSETLEYAIDDSAIAKLASALGDTTTAATFAEARRELAQPVQPGDRLPLGAARRRQLPSRPRVPGLTAPRHRPGRLGGRQLDPVHVECPARPARALRRDGRQRERRTQARSLLHPPQHQPQGAVQLGRRRTRARNSVGVRLRGRAVADARCRAPHRHRSLLADAER